MHHTTSLFGDYQPIHEFTDPTTGKVVRIQTLLSLAILAGFLAVIAVRLFGSATAVMPELVAETLLVCVAIVVAKMGAPNLSTLLLFTSLLSALFIIALKADGIHDAALIAVPGVLVVGCLMMKRLYFVITATVSILFIIGLGYAEMTGLLVTNFSAMTTYMDIIDPVVILVVSSASIWFISGIVFRSIQRIGQREELLHNQARRLADSERRYRTLFEAAHDTIFIMEGPNIIECNPMTKQLFGFESGEELVGLTPWDISPPMQPDGRDSSEKARNIIQAVLLGNPQVFMWKHQRKDGALIDVEVSLNRIQFDDRNLLQAILREKTGQIQAEAKLRENEERFRTIFENATVGLYRTSPDGRVLLANNTLIRMLGYSSLEEIRSINVEDHGFPSPRLRKQFQEMIEAEGQVVGLESEWSRKDGSTVYIRESARAVRDASNTTIYYEGTVENITERRLAEEELRKRDQQYTELIEQAAEGIFLVDMKGNFILVNPSFCRMLGYTADELSRLNILDTYPPELREIGINRLSGIGDGTDDRFERPMLRKDGSTIYVLAHARKNSSGLIQGVVYDITDRRRFEQALRESEQRFRTMFDQSPIGIELYDANGLQVAANKASLDMFGIADVSEVVGFDLFSGTSLNEELRSRLRRGESVRYQSRFDFDKVTSLGQYRTSRMGFADLEYIITPIISEGSGSVNGYLIQIQDVTERKKLEAQFLRAQRLESIGTLAGGISHDLNNVLAPIMMSIELMRNRHRDADSQHMLDTLQGLTERGADIVRQVLTFARGAGGEQSPLQLRHLLGEMVKIMRETFPRSIEIRSRAGQDISAVMGNPTQLHQVILNLCVNARDAMPDGGILTIEFTNTDVGESFARQHLDVTPGRYVRISISDTGIGIPPAVIDRIFEPFFTTKEVGKGTGLGLSTALAIVKSHNGFIDVDSIPREGTTFSIYLPALDSDVPEKRPAMPAVDTSGHGETILVIDDEDAVRDITRETLQANGYVVLTASDGAEGLTTFAEHRAKIACVLTDIMMPYLDGATTIRAIRRMRPDVRIIASSGLASNETALNLSDIKVDAFLTKPYTADRLLKIVREILPLHS